MKTSPYAKVPVSRWYKITAKLVRAHPLATEEIVEVVLCSWSSIFESAMGSKGFKIGKDIFPKPQIMGFLLHELIPLELAARHPKVWRPESSAGDKDLVYIPDPAFSIELKTSSNPYHIYGNRSYAQDSSANKKGKSGYYLAVNFQKFQHKQNQPTVRLIRFGWIDAIDWIGQKAATGQQSRLAPAVEQHKLIQLYQA